VGLTGGLDELSFADLVEMTALGRKTGHLTVFDVDGGVVGELDFCGGHLSAARCRELSPEKAFYALLAVREGSFSFDPETVDAEGVCDLRIDVLLMEGARRLDETRLLRERLPADAVVSVLGGEAQDALEARVLAYLGPGARTLGDIVQAVLMAEDADEYDTLRAIHRLGARDVVRIQVPGAAGPGKTQAEGPQPELER
jgi:hypothetical protein